MPSRSRAKYASIHAAVAVEANHFGVKTQDAHSDPRRQSANWSATNPSHTCAASIATFSLMNACWVPV